MASRVHGIPLIQISSSADRHKLWFLFYEPPRPLNRISHCANCIQRVKTLCIKPCKEPPIPAPTASAKRCACKIAGLFSTKTLKCKIESQSPLFRDSWNKIITLAAKYLLSSLFQIKCIFDSCIQECPCITKICQQINNKAEKYKTDAK